MYNSDNITYKNQRQMEMKLAGWIWHLFDACGITVTIFAFLSELDIIEKIILFLLSAAFFCYRIYHLHLDAEKKRNDMEEKKWDFKEKKKHFDVNKNL